MFAVHLDVVSMRWNPPPNWPQNQDGWTPPPGWEPDPAWGPAPVGWPLWVEDRPEQQPIIVQAGPGRSVTKQRKKTNHLLHLVLTLLTFGLWAPVWLFVHLSNKWGRKERVVTEYR